jgi:2,4-dienoyl-CoA reductase-like NADH-dependent reductase (Old Yellow Enzyme family)/pyruvate/2-oxoglutarate dehydrogenase complex dihydrolipoamide dehydrogenase (E3) component
MKLFEPLKVGSRIFKNRIMFAPINFCFEQDDNECLAPETIQYLTDIARGGAAYIVLGEVYPVDVKKKSPQMTSDDHIKMYKTLCNAIHKHDALIGAQIYYPDVDDLENLSQEKLMQIQNDYLRAVDRFVLAGFDAVQLSGEKFLGSLSSHHHNKRKDEYGGSLQNRMRFAAELIRKIKLCHPNTIVEYKLAVTDVPTWKGLTLDEARTAAKLLEDADLDLIHAAYTNPSHGETVPAMGIKSYGCFTHIAAAIKKEVAIPVSTVGRIIEAQTAEAILETEQADIIALGRSLIADPSWPDKVLNNKPIRYCISCNKCLDKIEVEKKLSCALHAGTGTDQSVIQKNIPQNVLIVGGGVAGMEAARLAALCGDTVTLYEKSFQLGGQVLLASAPPRKTELLRFINYLVQELIRLKVNIQLGKEIDEDFIIAECDTLVSFNRIVIATGGTSVTSTIQGADYSHVFDSWDILAGRKQVFGDVAVIGGGFVGIEVAEYLCTQGNKVSIIEMEDAIGIGQSSSIWPSMTANYQKHDVKFFASHTLKQITKDGIICGTKTSDVTISCNTVVMALNGKSMQFSLEKITNAGIKVDIIGDSKQIGDIEAAVNSAANIFSKNLRSGN